MLPDWAPKRIRITKDRESFFENQFCAVSKRGTGNIFEKMRNSKMMEKTKIQF